MPSQISFEKTALTGAEELTDSVFRHNQEAVHQAIEIDEIIDKTFPRLPELLEKWT